MRSVRRIAARPCGFPSIWVLVGSIMHATRMPWYSDARILERICILVFLRSSRWPIAPRSLSRRAFCVCGWVAARLYALMQDWPHAASFCAPSCACFAFRLQQAHYRSPAQRRKLCARMQHQYGACYRDCLDCLDCLIGCSPPPLGVSEQTREWQLSRPAAAATQPPASKGNLATMPSGSVRPLVGCPSALPSDRRSV